MVRLLIFAATLLAALLIGSDADASSLTCDAQTPNFTGGGSAFGRNPGQWNQYFGAKVDLNDGKACSPTIYDPTVLLPSGPQDNPLCLNTGGKLYFCAGGISLNALFDTAKVQSTGKDAMWSAIAPVGYLGGVLISDHLLSPLWRLSAPEAGGALSVTRYSAGTLVDVPLSVSNLTGRVTVLDGLTVSAGGLTVTAGGLNVTAGGLTVNGAGTMPTVTSNAALKALAANAVAVVERAGFTTAGDGGHGRYRWSGSACPSNGGAGDNGKEVAPTVGTGCWLLEKQAAYDVRQWGVPATNPIHLTVVQATASDTDLCGIVSVNPCKTIAGAQATANQLNVMGNVPEIDLPAGTFTECISQNAPLLGGANARPNPFSPGVNLGPSFLLVKGVGPTTIWDGCPSYYYTFQASNGGAIGIQDLQIRSTGIPGAQLSFAVQQGGQAYALGGITWGATSNVHVWAQDTGSLIVVAGADNITAGGNAFLYSAGGASIQVLGGALPWTASLTSGLTFAAFYNANDGGQIIDGATAGHSFGNSITGSPLQVGGSGLFLNLSGMAYDVLLPTATQIAISYSAGRILPEPPTSVTVPSTGCGSTCTTALTSYGPRSGYVTLTPGGTGISSAGGFNLANGIALYSAFFSPCMASINPSGTGSWSAGAAVAIGTPAIVANKETFTVSWANNSVNLTSGATYVINYICAD